MLKFIEISFNNIKVEIERFLKTEYNKANILFSPSSPYGQILSVLENLHQLSFLYLKNSINQFDITDPGSLNERIIRNAAIFAGHNPSRAISATGTLRFTLRPGTSIDKEIPGGRITFKNKTLIKNNTNSLNYSLNTGSEKITHKITDGYVFNMPIIQGKWELRTFTGTGDILQSFQIQESGQKDIENFNVEVLVNGDYWSIKKHIWEMLPDEESCVVRSGFNGGIDIIFGNGGFGKVPPLTSIIEVFYLVTDGSNGNIFRRTINDWKFVDDVIDGNGSSIDPANIFIVEFYNDINFGADKENILFTKNILPIASNNFVLGLPQQYAYEIKKLGVFSHVNAYEKLGTIFIVATPNIRLFKNRNSDYFTVNLRAFELDEYEKSKIDRYLRIGGNIQLTRRYVITSPKLSFYVLNIFTILYSDSNEDSVNAEILDKISEYFLDLKRIDRIPKLDIIKELSSIRDIHSIDIQFVSRNNEEYHKTQVENFNTKLTGLSQDEDINPSSIIASNNYNPNTTIGLDVSMGDIVFDPSEIPIIRGGWYDRNNNYYSDDITGVGLKSVNIIKNGTVPAKNRTSI
jgi:hypothetical protein